MISIVNQFIKPNNKIVFAFKEQFSNEARKSESQKIKLKYPDRVPTIVETSSNLVIDKRKYLVPYDITLSQFMLIIRKRLKLTPEQAIFMFLNNKMAPMAS